MNYVAPATLEEAYDALQAEEATCLAGGQSLVAMMNLGLASPGSVVSLRRLGVLRGIRHQSDGSLRIGAMVTHAELAALQVSAPGPALLAKAAKVVAYPAIRARGTIGGSVALADPSADYPVVLQAADAVIELGSATGTRMVPARDFFVGLFETARVPGEIVLAIQLPAGPAGGGSAYEKLTLVAGDFAIVSVAAIAGVGEKGTGEKGADSGRVSGDRASLVHTTVDLAVGGCGTTPIRLSGIEASDASLLAAGRELAATCNPTDDHRASAAYRRRVLPELIRRAGRAAASGVSA